MGKIPPMELKTCTRCKEDKPPEAFSVDRKRKDGLNVYCRDCRRLMHVSKVKPPPPTILILFKTCQRCDETKSSDDFNKDSYSVDGLKMYCRDCMSDINQAYRDSEEGSALALARRRKAYDRTSRVIWNHLLANPCVDCGEADPIVLEFDHVRGEKSFSIGQARSRYMSLETLMAEIAKCDVRCANCHRRVTAARGGYYINVMTVDVDDESA